MAEIIDAVIVMIAELRYTSPIDKTNAEDLLFELIGEIPDWFQEELLDRTQGTDDGTMSNQHYDALTAEASILYQSLSSFAAKLVKAEEIVDAFIVIETLEAIIPSDDLLLRDNSNIIALVSMEVLVLCQQLGKFDPYSGDSFYNAFYHRVNDMFASVEFDTIQGALNLTDRAVALSEMTKGWLKVGYHTDSIISIALEKAVKGLIQSKEFQVVTAISGEENSPVVDACAVLAERFASFCRALSRNDEAEIYDRLFMDSAELSLSSVGIEEQKLYDDSTASVLLDTFERLIKEEKLSEARIVAEDLFPIFCGNTGEVMQKREYHFDSDEFMDDDAEGPFEMKQRFMRLCANAGFSSLALKVYRNALTFLEEERDDARFQLLNHLIRSLRVEPVGVEAL